MSIITTPPVVDVNVALNPGGPPPVVKFFDGGPANFALYHMVLFVPQGIPPILGPGAPLTPPQVDSRTNPNVHPVAGPAVPAVVALTNTAIFCPLILTSPVIGTWTAQVKVEQNGVVIGVGRIAANAATLPQFATGTFRIFFV